MPPVDKIDDYTGMVPYWYSIEFEYDGEHRLEVVEQAMQMVKGGGGIVEWEAEAWPGFGYWMVHDAKNPLEPTLEEFKGKIKVERGSTEEYRIWHSDNYMPFP